MISAPVLQTEMVDLAAEKLIDLAVAIQARILKGQQPTVPERKEKDGFTELLAMPPSKFVAFSEGAGEVCWCCLVTWLTLRF